jgi:hypothetical protein
MGRCRYCGRFAGLFTSEHPECSVAHSEGLTLFFRLTQDTYRQQVSLDGRALRDSYLSDIDSLDAPTSLGPAATVPRLPPQVARLMPVVASLIDRLPEIQRTHFITNEERELTILSAVESARDMLLADHMPTDDEQLWHGELIARLLTDDKAYSVSDLRQKDGYVLALSSLISRGVSTSGPHSAGARAIFRIAPHERVVWLEEDGINYFKLIASRRFEVSSQGVPVRLASGVYFRTGAFSSHPVETQTMRAIDVGPLALTTEALYFGGRQEPFRLPYSQVLSKDVRADGLLFWKSRAEATTEAFQRNNGLGWFLANLIESAPEIAVKSSTQK